MSVQTLEGASLATLRCIRKVSTLEILSPLLEMDKNTP